MDESFAILKTSCPPKNRVSSKALRLVLPFKHGIFLTLIIFEISVSLEGTFSNKFNCTLMVDFFFAMEMQWKRCGVSLVIPNNQNYLSFNQL